MGSGYSGTSKQLIDRLRRELEMICRFGLDEKRVRHFVD